MNLIKHCWKNRWIRRLISTAVTLVTLYVLLCAWLNWKWGRQWIATAEMLKSEGETLDFRLLTNDPVPEEENFCAIPLLKDTALAVDDDSKKGEPAAKRERLKEMNLPDDKDGKRPELANPGYGKRTDLKAWADWLRKDGSLPMPADSGNAAHDLVAGLAKHDAIVRELAAGLNRTKAQWTPEWRTRELPEHLFAIQFPHSMSSRYVNQSLSLLSTASARAGKATQAHEATLIMARLNLADQNDPFLIGILVAASNAPVLCGSTWEQCDAQLGTAEDFARLESALAALDFHKTTLRAYRGEIAAGVNTTLFLRRNPSAAAGLFEVVDDKGKSVGTTLGKLAMRAVPLGFFDASAAVIADHEFKYLIKPLRDSGWNDARAGSVSFNSVLETKGRSWKNPTYIMAVMAAPAMSACIHRAIYAQTIVNQAAIGCALERHRIESGSYPDSLDALKLANGDSLPFDVINDKPMGYRRTPDGKYRLWSIGFDGKDDGGKRAVDKKHTDNTSFSDANYVGDWVWDFPDAK